MKELAMGLIDIALVVLFVTAIIGKEERTDDFMLGPWPRERARRSLSLSHIYDRRFPEEGESK